MDTTPRAYNRTTLLAANPVTLDRNLRRVRLMFIVADALRFPLLLWKQSASYCLTKRLHTLKDTICAAATSVVGWCKTLSGPLVWPTRKLYNILMRILRLLRFVVYITRSPILPFVLGASIGLSTVTLFYLIRLYWRAVVDEACRINQVRRDAEAALAARIDNPDSDFDDFKPPPILHVSREVVAVAPVLDAAGNVLVPGRSTTVTIIPGTTLYKHEFKDDAGNERVTLNNTRDAHGNFAPVGVDHNHSHYMAANAVRENEYMLALSAALRVEVPGAAFAPTLATRAELCQRARSYCNIHHIPNHIAARLIPRAVAIAMIHTTEDIEAARTLSSAEAARRRYALAHHGPVADIRLALDRATGLPIARAPVARL